MLYLTPSEARFIRTSIKDSLSVLNEERTKAAAGADMVRLMKVEEVLADAESAWDKLKGIL